MTVELTDFKELDNFPTAEALAFYDDKLYIIGNDAKQILITNKKWKKPEPLSLASPPQKGTEATTIVYINDTPHLLILSPGSGDMRNQAILLNMYTGTYSATDISTFYTRLQNSGIPALDIEGAALVNDYLVLCSRGNTTHPDNYLIITSADFWTRQQEAPIQVVKADIGKTEGTARIAGIVYSQLQEYLLLAIAVDDTTDGNKEGKTRRSYLGIIENVYRKIGREKTKMKVNQLVDLNPADKQFKGYTIESMAIQSEKDYSLKLHMLAAGDKGAGLFKITLKF